MSLNELAEAVAFNRQVAYILIGLMIVQIVADVIVFQMSIAILRRAKVYLDLAAKHGEQTDQRAARVEEKLEKRANVLPSVLPPEARKGCGPSLLPVVAVLLVLGWAQSRIVAAEDLRADAAANALAWWADQPHGNPSPGS